MTIINKFPLLFRVDKCRAFCAGRGFAYAGVQYFKECFCGNSYGRYGNINTSECNTRCVGNEGQLCGGGWALGVWRTSGLPQPSVTSAASTAPPTAAPFVPPVFAAVSVIS